MFKSLEGGISLHIAALGFVDDSTMMIDEQSYEPVEELLRRKQEDGELWSNLLFSSKKWIPCIFLHLQTNQRTSDATSLWQTSSIQKQEKSNNANTGKTKIQHGKIRAPQSTDRQLGITNRGNHEKAKSISEGIIRTNATRSETRMLYESVFRPATEYTLAQSFIPATNLTIIEKKRSQDYTRNVDTTETHQEQSFKARLNSEEQASSH